MIRAFIDTSVLFSACLSATGASRALMIEAVGGRLTLVISDVVLEEANRNLTGKAPHVLPVLAALLATIPFEVVVVPVEAIQAAEVYTVRKDAPIAAGAKVAGVDHLCSLDRKDLVDNAEVIRQSGLSIVLPGQLLDMVRTSPNE
jgi:predicted nucleic acid-binding protein